MSLIPCKECGKEISTKAEKCPNCGVTIARKTSIGTWIGAIFIVYILYSIGTCSSPSPTKSTVNQTPTVKPVDPMVEYNALMQKHAEDKRFELTAAMVKTLKNSLRDPKSVEWIDIYANEDASVVCVQYRAKNGFGGMNKEFVTFKNMLPTKKAKTWNDNCAHTDLIDMRFVENAIN